MSQATPQQRRRAFILVVLSTFLLAAAQTLLKSGTADLPENPTLLDTAIGMLTTPRLFLGYSIYGLFTVAMVWALRYCELSVLYPVIALGYVWVAIVSVVKFHETMNPLKIAGVLVIIAGVALLGRGQEQKQPEQAS